MQYHVDFNGLEEYKKEFKNKIKTFTDELDKILNYKNDLIWNGKGSEVVLNDFSDKMSDLYVIPQILELYVKFMETSLSDYGAGLEEIKKSFNDILNHIREEKSKRGEIF